MAGFAPPAALSNLENGVFVRKWNNSREIAIETGMSDWSISECCRGNRKTAYGYKWQYAS